MRRKVKRSARLALKGNNSLSSRIAKIPLEVFMRRIWILVFFLGVSRVGFAQTQELILPFVVNGYVRPPIHYQTTIRIVNLTPNPVQVTLEAYQNDGTAVRILELFPVARTGTKTVLNIDGFGSLEAFTAEDVPRSEEHTSELQSLAYLVCRLLLEKKKNTDISEESSS